MEKPSRLAVCPVEDAYPHPMTPSSRRGRGMPSTKVKSMDGGRAGALCDTDRVQPLRGRLLLVTTQWITSFSWSQPVWRRNSVMCAVYAREPRFDQNRTEVTKRFRQAPHSSK